MNRIWETSVIIVTVAWNHEDTACAVREGAKGYMLKRVRSEQVRQSVIAAAEEGSAIDASLAPVLVREYQRMLSPATPAGLFDSGPYQRNLPLLRLLAAGHNNRHIAAELSFAESTVKNCLSRLSQSIGVRDRAQAVIYALAEGLVARPKVGYFPRGCNRVRLRRVIKSTGGVSGERHRCVRGGADADRRSGGSAQTEQRRGRVDSQVIGGTSVKEGAYPFVAALLEVRNGRSAYTQQFRGGTLIDETHVLTAAQCAPARRNLKYIRVVAGRTVRSSNQGQLRRAVAVKIHPGFSPRSRVNDAAILTLSAVINRITPARVATQAGDSYETQDTLLTVAGWGNTVQQSPSMKEPDKYPNEMREANVPAVSDRQCQQQYGSRGFSASTMLCAGKPGVDSCQGDSGGPLSLRSKVVRSCSLGSLAWGLGAAPTNTPASIPRSTASQRATS